MRREDVRPHTKIIVQNIFGLKQIGLESTLKQTLIKIQLVFNLVDKYIML